MSPLIAVPPCLRRVVVPAFLACLFPVLLAAQRIVISDTSALPVRVESARVSTEVAGGLAVTTFDLVFRNPNASVLEGQFEFPLLDGQGVIRFALDINGQLREAVPVEKERGRVVFEEIARRRVDPGLLEKTAGNNYRARVFPLPAGGTRRIVLAYQEDLRRGTGGSRDYRVALNFPDTLKDFALSIAITGEDSGEARARTSLDLDLPAWNRAHHLELERRDIKAVGVLELTLPSHPAPAVVTGRHGDDEYFLAQVPVVGLGPAAARPAPRVIGLLWDASGSGSRRDHARELALLEALFAELGSVQVKLFRLQDKVRQAGTFDVTKGKWRSLKRALEEMEYDAASSLDGLAEDPEVDEWLLFSDGLINYGVSLGMRALPLARPVHCVVAASGANSDWLRGLAQRSGGAHVDLYALDTAAAVRTLRSRSLRVLDLEQEGHAFAELFPERGALVEGDLVRVAGRLRKQGGLVRLRVGHDLASSRLVELEVKSGENHGTLAARGWALEKIRALSLDPEGNREDLRRTSREFCIVTPDTSLIVLEELADYERFGITPPPALREAWEGRRQIAARVQAADKQAHLSEVLARFQAQVRWWEADHPKGDVPNKERETWPRENRSFLAAPAQHHRPPAIPGASARREPLPDPRAAPDEEIIALDAFSVETDEDIGYMANNTFSGTRIRTELRDVASSVSTRAQDADKAPAPRQEGEATIALRPWKARAGYLDRLQRSSEADWDGIYHEERDQYASTPGFYLDVAEFLFSKERPEEALSVLSNLAELALEDAGLLRVLASRLMQAGRPELAVPLLERVLLLRGEEPQSYRDLALALAETGRRQRAIELLWQVVVTPWHNRFPDVELIALGELNAIVATSPEKLDTSAMDPRLLGDFPLGLRVVLNWDADNCDIDLWVRDPNGEDVGYNHIRSYQGGKISRDFTGGYGPEEFALRKPKAGDYTLRVNYFGDNRQTSFGPVTAQILVYTGFGTPQQKMQRMTLRLSEKKENAPMGRIEIKAATGQ